MRYRIFTAAATAALIFNAVAIAGGDNRSAKAKARAARLVAMLPASDGVAMIDTKRLLDIAVPTALVSNQPLLAKITENISGIHARTGIDLRSFAQVAVGLTVKQGLTNDLDIDAIAVASGTADLNAVVAAAKSAAGGSVREEAMNGRTIMIFRPHAASDKSPGNGGAIHDTIAKALRQEIAMAVIDPQTLAVGSLARVRETLSGHTHVARDINRLLPTKGAAINFAVRNGGLLSAMLPVDNDDLGKKVAAVQVVSGSIDLAAAGLTIAAVAKTPSAAEALSLKDLLEVLRDMGGLVWGQSKNADKQLYSRSLRAVKLGTRAADVTLDITIPQSDIDILVSKLK